MVIITTMNKLPDYCYECPCHDGENGQCRADANGRYSSEYRPYWCPLKDMDEATQNTHAYAKEVMKHGQGIDETKT